MSAKGIVRTVTSGTTASLLVPARSGRKVLVLFPHSVNSYTVSDSSTVVNGEGIFVPMSADPVVLDRAVVGDLVAQALYVIAGSASTTFGFIEVVDG